MHSDTGSTVSSDFNRCQEAKTLLVRQIHHFLEKKLNSIECCKTDILRTEQDAGSDVFLNTFIGFQELVTKFEKFCKVLPLVLDKIYSSNDSNIMPSPTIANSNVQNEESASDQLTKSSSQSSEAKALSHDISSGMTINELLPPVDVKDNFIAYMVHCESSEAIFCTPKKLLKQYNELEENVVNLRDKVPLEVESIGLPAMALAPSKKYPGCLYRALVLAYNASNAGATCKVMFVDWGNEEIVDAKKVLKISAKFCMLPPAVKISLTYGEDGTRFRHPLPHSKRVTNLLKKVLTGKDGHALPIRVQVYERPTSAGGAFQVYASLQNEKDCIRSKIADQLSELPNATEPNSPPKQAGRSNGPSSAGGHQNPKSAHKSSPQQSHQPTTSRTDQGSNQRAQRSTQIERFYTNIVEPANVNSLDDMSVIAKEDKLEVFLQSDFGYSALPPEDEISIAHTSPCGSQITSISQRPPNIPYRFNGNFNF